MLKKNMETLRKGAFLTLASAVFLSFLALHSGPASAAGAPHLRVLASTYPVYLFTRTVVQARPHVQVDLLIPAMAGCPHDYALSPRDMQKLSSAHVVVLNGLGLEVFMEKPLQNLGKKMKIIDSGAGIVPLPPNNAHEHAAHGHGQEKDRHQHQDHMSGTAHSHEHGEGHGHEDGHEPEDGRGHHHDRGGVNPHAFASPRQAAHMVRNIAEGLAAVDPEGAAAYRASAEACAARLQDIDNRLTAVGARASNKDIVLLHDGLAYLLRDAGLHLAAVIQEDEHSQPSAARLVALTGLLRNDKPALLVGEPQYSDKPVQVLSRELGVPAIVLDSVASGPADPAPDHYERVMINNCDMLEKSLVR